MVLLDNDATRVSQSAKLHKLHRNDSDTSALSHSNFIVYYITGYSAVRQRSYPSPFSPLRSSIARCTSSFSNTARCKLDRDARPLVLTSVTAFPE